MHSQQLAHPTRDELNAYLLGKASDAEIDTIDQHLAHCPSCCEAIKGLKDDAFVRLVQSCDTIDESLVAPTDSFLRPTPDATDATATPKTRKRVAEGATATLAVVEENAIYLDANSPACLVHHPRYQIREIVGEGGMGKVYCAEHRKMKRPVALKIINSKLVKNQTAVERFHREVEAAARLDHPNIVTAYDADQVGEVHFLVMEYVRGTDLAKVVGERGPLPVREACDYVRQAALGLQHAQDHGMVHRDIKPQNLMRTQNGQVKILDFGLASLSGEPSETATQGLSESTQEDQQNKLTQTGSFMGTPDYMAPEQASDAHCADTRSDIYSLGCTLYYLLSGQVPYPGGSGVDKMHAHAKRQPQPINELRPDVPSEVVKVLQRMMQKHPADRYQSPSEVAKELEPYRQDTEKRSGARRFIRALIAIAAVFLLVLLAGVIYVTTDNGQLKIDCKVDDVQVVLSKGGKEFEVIDVVSGTKIRRLPSGDYKITIKGRTDVKLSKKGFTMTRWGRVIVTVTRKPTNPKTKAPRIRLLLALREHTDSVLSVTYSPKGRYIASASCDGTVKLWDTTTFKVIHTMHGHTDLVARVIFSPDGKLLATTGNDKTIRIWETSTGKQLRILNGDNGYGRALAFSPNGKWLAFGSTHYHEHRTKRLPDVPRQILLMEVATGRTLTSLHGHDRSISHVEFSANGKRLLSSSYDQTVKVWDTNTGKLLHTLRGHRHGVHRARYSPNNELIASSDTDGYVRIWNATTGKLLDNFSNPANAQTLDFSPSGRHIAVGCHDGVIRIWDLHTKKMVIQLAGHIRSVNAVEFSLDGTRLVSSGKDTTLRTWDVSDLATKSSAKRKVGKVTTVTNKAPVKQLKLHWETVKPITTAQLRQIAFANGQYLAVGSNGTCIVSKDAVSWTHTSVPTHESVCTVAYGKGVWVIGGSSYPTPHLLLASRDRGKTWIQTKVRNRVGIVNRHGIGSIVYRNGKFLAVTFRGYVLMSTDGINWWEVGNATRTTAYTVAYGDGKCVVAGYRGSVGASQSLSGPWNTWTLGKGSYYASAYGNNRFVIGGPSGIWSAPYSLSKWKFCVPRESASVSHIIFAEGRFLAVGQREGKSLILASSDGINWYDVALPDTKGLRGVVYDGSRYVCVGDEGTILIGTEKR